MGMNAKCGCGQSGNCKRRVKVTDNVARHQPNQCALKEQHVSARWRKEQQPIAELRNVKRKVRKEQRKAPSAAADSKATVKAKAPIKHKNGRPKAVKQVSGTWSLDDEMACKHKVFASTALCVPISDAPKVFQAFPKGITALLL
jgi:hypothetical protein